MKFLMYISNHGTILGIVPCIIALIRFRQIDPRFRPFIFLVWVSFANDCLNYVTGKYLRTNAPNQDIYHIIEFSLVVWLFDCWHLFGRRVTPKLILGAASLMWLIEVVFFRSLWDFDSVTHVAVAFASVLMSIQYINKLILNEQKLNLTNSEFLICIAFVFYFSAATITELFWMYGFTTESHFADKVFVIMSYTNTFSYLIFAAALLCAPKKQRFLQLS